MLLNEINVLVSILFLVCVKMKAVKSHGKAEPPGFLLSVGSDPSLHQCSDCDLFLNAVAAKWKL